MNVSCSKKRSRGQQTPSQRLASTAQNPLKLDTRCVESIENESKLSHDPNRNPFPCCDRSTCVRHRSLYSPSSFPFPWSHSPSKMGALIDISLLISIAISPRDLDPAFGNTIVAKTSRHYLLVSSQTKPTRRIAEQCDRHRASTLDDVLARLVRSDACRCERKRCKTREEDRRGSRVEEDGATEVD